MTLAEAIYQRSLSLPDAAAQEALDFIEFLGQRYGTAAGIIAPTDAWFQAEVQRAIDDSRAPIQNDQVSQHFAARRDALRTSMHK